MSKHKREIDVFEKHKIAIAKRTLQMSDVGAFIMGGMTKKEAIYVLLQHNISLKPYSVKPSDYEK